MHRAAPVSHDSTILFRGYFLRQRPTSTLSPLAQVNSKCTVVCVGKIGILYRKVKIGPFGYPFGECGDKYSIEVCRLPSSFTSASYLNTDAFTCC
jgi:hypothetical protein